MVAPAQVRERDLFRCARCGSATDLHAHHRRMRSQGGRDSYSNQVTLCARCHSWVHAHPVQASAGGWLITSAVHPGLVRVQHHAWPAGPIWLRDDGTVSLLEPEARELQL